MILHDKARSVRVCDAHAERPAFQRRISLAICIEFARARHVRLVRYVAAASADVRGVNLRS